MRLVLAPIGAGRAQTPTMQQIVDLYANASIANGFEAGIVLTGSTNGNPDILARHIRFSLYRAGLLAH